MATADPMSAAMSASPMPTYRINMGSDLSVRVQYINDLEPFSSTNFPEPTRPPRFAFNIYVPLIDQLDSVHALLNAPHKLEDCALQLSHNGTYLDLESGLDEQRDELEGFNPEKRNTVILRTSLSVRVHSCIEKLLNSSGRELRRALFSLKQIFQDDKDLVHEFVNAEGLDCLIKVGSEADQNYQNYILRALGQVMLYVDGMNGVIAHNETIQWLYSLLSSKFRLVVKTSLKLLLVFVEYTESNTQLLIKAVNIVDRQQSHMPWHNVVQILSDEGQDSEVSIFAMTLVNKALNAVPDQETFYDITDTLEEQGMEKIANKHKSKVGGDLDLIAQFKLYEDALKLEDDDNETTPSEMHHKMKKRRTSRQIGGTGRRSMRRSGGGGLQPTQAYADNTLPLPPADSPNSSSLNDSNGPVAIEKGPKRRNGVVTEIDSLKRGGGALGEEPGPPPPPGGSSVSPPHRLQAARHPPATHPQPPERTSGFPPSVDRDRSSTPITNTLLDEDAFSWEEEDSSSGYNDDSSSDSSGIENCNNSVTEETNSNPSSPCLSPDNDLMDNDTPPVFTFNCSVSESPPHSPVELQDSPVATFTFVCPPAKARSKVVGSTEPDTVVSVDLPLASSANQVASTAALNGFAETEVDCSSSSSNASEPETDSAYSTHSESDSSVATSAASEDADDEFEITAPTKNALRRRAAVHAKRLSTIEEELSSCENSSVSSYSSSDERDFDYDSEGSDELFLPYSYESGDLVTQDDSTIVEYGDDSLTTIKEVTEISQSEFEGEVAGTTEDFTEGDMDVDGWEDEIRPIEDEVRPVEEEAVPIEDRVAPAPSSETERPGPASSVAPRGDTAAEIALAGTTGAVHAAGGVGKERRPPNLLAVDGAWRELSGEVTTPSEVGSWGGETCSSDDLALAEGGSELSSVGDLTAASSDNFDKDSVEELPQDELSRDELNQGQVGQGFEESGYHLVSTKTAPVPLLPEEMPGTSDTAVDQDMPGTSDTAVDQEMPGTSDTAAVDQEMPGTSDTAVDQEMPGTSDTAAVDQEMPGTSDTAAVDQDKANTSEPVQAEALPLSEIHSSESTILEKTSLQIRLEANGSDDIYSTDDKQGDPGSFEDKDEKTVLVVDKITVTNEDLELNNTTEINEEREEETAVKEDSRSLKRDVIKAEPPVDNNDSIPSEKAIQEDKLSLSGEDVSRSDQTEADISADVIDEGDPIRIINQVTEDDKSPLDKDSLKSVCLPVEVNELIGPEKCSRDDIELDKDSAKIPNAVQDNRRRDNSAGFAADKSAVDVKNDEKEKNLDANLAKEEDCSLGGYQEARRDADISKREEKPAPPPSKTQEPSARSHSKIRGAEIPVFVFSCEYFIALLGLFLLMNYYKHYLVVIVIVFVMSQK